jgi:hypothetical protein
MRNKLRGGFVLLVAALALGALTSSTALAASTNNRCGTSTARSSAAAIPLH